MNARWRATLVIAWVVLAAAILLAAVSAAPVPGQTDPSRMTDEAAQPISTYAASQSVLRPAHYSLMYVEKAFGGAVQTAAVSGTMIYAAVGLRLVVIDASDANRPTWRGAVRPPELTLPMRQLAVWRNFVIALAAGHLAVFDVGEPESPFLSAWLPWADAPNMVIDQNRLYLVDPSPTGTTLDILDLSELPRLKVLGSYLLPPGNRFRLLATDGHFCFLAEGRDYGPYTSSFPQIVSVDVSDPAQMTINGFLGRYDPTSAAIVGSYAYIGAGVPPPGDPTGSTRAGIAVLDLSNPLLIKPVNFVEVDRSEYRAEIVLADAGRLLVNGTNKLLVFDISQPTSPYLKVVFLSPLLAAGRERGVSTVNGSIGTNSKLLIADLHPSHEPAWGGDLALWPGHSPMAAVGGLLAVAVPGSGLELIDLGQSDGVRPVTVGVSPESDDNQVVAVAQDQVFVRYGDASGDPASRPSGVRVVSLADPKAPREIARNNRAPRGCTRFSVDGTLWIQSLVAGSLEVLDATDPFAPRPLATVISLWGDSAICRWAVLRHRLYVTEHQWSGRLGVRSIDLATPNIPQEGGRIGDRVAIDVAILGDKLMLVDAVWMQMPVSPALSEYQVHVIDVSDPSRPRQTAALSLSALGAAWPLLVTAHDDLLVVAVGYLSGQLLRSGERSLAMYRLTESGKLAALGQTPPTSCDVLDLLMVGGRLALPTSDCGLLVLAPAETVWHAYLPAAWRH